MTSTVETVEIVLFAPPTATPPQVPDYYDIITQPMDLSTVMRKIDDHRYTVPRQWLDDIDLITKNALE